MKKISDILRKKQVLYPLIALAGFVLGWLLFSPSSSPESAGGTHAEAHNHDMHGTSHDLVQDESGVWTCIRRFVRTNPANALSAVWT